MAIKSDIREAVPFSLGVDELAANEQLLAEIDRLQREIDRLSDQLQEERLDRGIQLEVHTVLSSLTNPPEALDPAGRRLSDGRYIPPPVADGGNVAAPEPGAPRVVDDSSCEFAPGDESATAFDQFFNAPDPQLDQIRRFLLG